MTMQKGRPQRIAFFDDVDVTKLRLGMRHSAALSGDGRLFMFGSGNWGILGQGNEQNVSHDAPVVVQRFEQLGLKVVDVAVGDYHTVALTEDGNVWTWGYGGKKGMFNWMYSQEIGALGHGNKDAHYMPTKVAWFEERGIKIKSIAAGLYHCVAIDEENQMYSWGRGLYGVLGNGNNDYQLLPQKVETIEGVKQESTPAASVARFDATDEMTVALTDNGFLNSWGKNDRGQLGISAGIGIDMVESECVPCQVAVLDADEEQQPVKDFAIGQNTMLIKDEADRIYQVGLKLHYEPKQLHFDPEVLDTS